MTDIETAGGEAPGEDRAVKTKKRRRNDIIRDIYLAGWTGPISYSNEKLEEMLVDIRAGREPDLPSRGRRRKAAAGSEASNQGAVNAAGEPGGGADVVTAAEAAEANPGPVDTEE